MANRVKSANRPGVIYLYGVTAKSIAGAKAVGVDGKAKVIPFACAGVVCWISHVSKTEFADNLTKNMENMDWLSEAGVRHQGAISSIAEAGDILPARFGTVFLNTSSLEADVQKRKNLLSSDLRRVRSSAEWGVKVFSLPQPSRGKPKQAATGRDYLKRKAELLHRPTGVSKDDLDSFSTALNGISVEMAVGAGIAGGQRSLQWQSSLLLKKKDRKKLEAVLKKYSKRWSDSARIECTGPWPPYSFVSRDI